MPSENFEETKYSVNSANGREIKLTYKINNVTICKKQKCIPDITLFQMKGMTEDLIL